jgi:hypothetical protein
VTPGVNAAVFYYCLHVVRPRDPSRLRYSIRRTLICLALPVIVATVSLAPADGDARALEVAERRPLSWPPPQLVRPTYVRISNEGQAAPGLPGQSSTLPSAVVLEPGRDYVLRIDHRRSPGGLRVQGGRNVVIIGGRITPTLDADARNGRGLTFFDQTGIVHIEGVLIHGAGDGILIAAPRATFQIQNVRVNVSAPNHDFSINHPDVIQTWSGPAEIRIDRMTNSSDYQGFFWYRDDAVSTTIPPGRVIQRRVNFRVDPTQTGRRPTLHHVTSHLSPSTKFSCSDCWMQTGWRGRYRRKLQDSILPYYDQATGRFKWPPFRVTSADGRVTTGLGRSGRSEMGRSHGDRIEWPSSPNLAKERWHWGSPPGGDFVPAKVPGTEYVSPGYVKAKPRS